MSEWWDGIEHFTPEEFDSPDQPGSGREKMKRPFVEVLDQARGECGFAFIITSGYRTPQHNMDVGGVDSSSHVRGWAADLAVRGSRQRFLLMNTCLELGISRFGIGDRFVHVDMDPDKDSDVMWTY